MTEIGEIPEEWSLDILENEVEIMDSRRVPLSEVEREQRKGPFPYCGANGIIDYVDDYIFDEEAILLAEDGGSYGKFQNSAYLMDGKYWVNNHAHIIKGKRGIVNNKYILYWLNYSDINKYISGSTRAKLNQERLKSIPIPRVPLPEQQKIAEILSTADDEIRKVDKQIALTEQFKKGLMQKLLTRGIGHTKFKMTEIGEIPEEWSVMTIRDCSAPTGNINPASTFGKDEFYYVDVSGISSEKLAITETKRIRGIDSPSRARKLIKKDDVIFATIRPYLKRVAIVPENLDGNICSTAFCVIRANRNIILPSFLYYYAILDNFVNRVSGFQTGSAYPAVSDDQILSELIAIPKLHEQDKVSEILSTVDNKLELLGNKREKLDALKKGLMNDLLTGKVRVKV